MDIKVSERWKLGRQAVLSTIGHKNHKPLKINELGGLYRIETEGHGIYVPSALRWKLYRWGWDARLERLSNEYAFSKYKPVEAGGVVIDIGANAGEFAFIAANAGASCYCLEPDPLINVCAEMNTQNLSNVKIFNDVIWKCDEEIDFYMAPQRADSSVFSVSGNSVKKQALTLASFIEREGLTRIDFVKCDAEGAEPEVLEGVGDAHKNIGVFAFDTGAERDGKRTNKECAEIFASWGFDVHDVTVGKRCMTYGVNPDF